MVKVQRLFAKTNLKIQVCRTDKIPLVPKGRTTLCREQCALRSFIPGQQKKTARPRMLRHFVPSRWLHPLAPQKRLSPVDLPSANSMKCCSPPASLKANKMNFMEQANRNCFNMSQMEKANKKLLILREVRSMWHGRVKFLATNLHIVLLNSRKFIY